VAVAVVVVLRVSLLAAAALVVAVRGHTQRVCSMLLILARARR